MTQESVFQKLISLGWGIFSKEKDEVRKAIEKTVKEGEIRREEGEKLIRKVTRLIDKQGKEIQKTVENEVSKALDKIGIVSRKEFDNLMKKLEKLESKTDVRRKPRKKKKVRKSEVKVEALPEVSTAEG